MGIHGLLRELGAGERISLAKFSAHHYTTHSRPLRLAIDISVWLFQIQSGRGGSNPALRTFYYRLLRLLSLNIHPLFVFDGPNKPLFKRNKKVGGPGVRVASVPEFLAKQLLKQFGFPWHVAPGEAEAECALLQREGVVDAVMSEDVDTLMFGANVWLRNWTAENTTKSPTHVTVHRAKETWETSCGIDRDGMILVALMSGGDYLPEGIPGCGPKVACDAARAGYGRELCALERKDFAGLKLWKENLQHQIRTNEAKYFSRKNPSFTMPDDFPNVEVLGYYTRPCVSTPEKVQRLKDTVKWDVDIDFAALRTFTADAFDWRCRGGAKKFIKNLAPAMLVRELRLQGHRASASDDLTAQAQAESLLVRAVHGQRNHSTVDGELEYRISFTPASLVSIDLNNEEDDNDFIPAGAGDAGEDTETESECVMNFSSTAQRCPNSPSKKRQFRPYDPDKPEKIWILRSFLQIGCPLLVEEYDASLRDPKKLLKQRRRAWAAGKCVDGNFQSGDSKRARSKNEMDKTMPRNTLVGYARITKAAGNLCGDKSKEPLRESWSRGNSRKGNVVESVDESLNKAPGFILPSNLPSTSTCNERGTAHKKQPVPDIETENLPEGIEATSRPFAPFARRHLSKEETSGLRSTTTQPQPKNKDLQKTPSRRKRRSPEMVSPALGQKTITTDCTPSPQKPITKHFKPDDAAGHEIAYVDLISSTPAQPSEVAAPNEREQPQSPTPPNLRLQFFRAFSPNATAEIERHLVDSLSTDVSPLPESVTRRRKRTNGLLRRHGTAPVPGKDGVNVGDDGEVLGWDDSTSIKHCCGGEAETKENALVQAMDLARPSIVSKGSIRGLELIECSDDDEDSTNLSGPMLLLRELGRPSTCSTSGFDTTSRDERNGISALSSCQTPPVNDENRPRPAGSVLPTANSKRAKPCETSNNFTASLSEKFSQETVVTTIQPTTCRSQHHSQSTAREKRRKALILRQSLEGAWKEIDAEALDLSGDGSGYKVSQGKATVVGCSSRDGRVWRKSGVEILDLTGA